jgi:ectoine hydroxylase-related dioxygenase (phytanoyl-CoA dioxygenase family)
MTEQVTSKEQLIFQNQGWYISKQTLPIDLIKQARNAVDSFYHGEVDHKIKNNTAIANDGHDESSALRNNEFVTLQKQAFADLAFHPIVLSHAAKLLNSNTVNLFADSLVNKKPQKSDSLGVVGWHSDVAYWPTCSSKQLLTAWIPLQDVTVEMGPLELLSESNKWHQDQQIKELFGFGKPDLSKLETRLIELGYSLKPQLMTLKAGQVSFHHCDTIHCSRPNISNSNRIALAVHFQGETNSYKPAFKPCGEKIEISYDKICRKDEKGNPDYRDPDFFPLLWQNGIKVF